MPKKGKKKTRLIVTNLGKGKFVKHKIHTQQGTRSLITHYREVQRA